MALRLALVLDGDARGAVIAARQTSEEIDRITAATRNQTAAAEANAAANARASQSFNTANVAAQFQDIAVTSAMGMSPLQIALQQGTQLSAVLGAQGAAGAARTLLGAVTSILNPVSLLTIAVVGFGAAAIQAFGAMASGSDKASMSLEEHEKWLRELLTGYDAAAKAAKTASEAANTLPKGVVASDLSANLADQAKATEDLQGKIDRAKSSLNDTANFLKELQAAGQSIGGDGSGIQAMIDQVQSLRDLGLSTSNTKEELEAATVAARQLFNATDDPSIKEMADNVYQAARQLAVLQGEAYASAAALATLNNQAALTDLSKSTDSTVKAIDRLKALAPDLRDGYAKARDALNEALGASPDGALRAAAQDQYDKTIAALDAQKAQQAAKKAASAGNKVSDYERELTASREKTAATQLEIAMIGQSTFASEKARKILELETAAKKDAIGLSSARIAAIQAEADAHAAAAAELENTKGVWSEIQQAGQTAMDSILDSVLSGGKNIGDVLKNIAQQYLKLVIQMSVTNPLQNALLGTSSPTFGANPIASFISGLFGKREFGGPVVAGRPYIVGEKRPEIFVPTSSGTIIPNTSMMGSAGGGMRFSQTIINNSQERVQSRQRQRADGSVYQELVIGATQRGMEKGQFRGFGIQSPTKSR